ncbi:MAG: N-acetyl-gamma-glutamyl-phosphate reductase [Balneolales bacterium]|nr:N-acetyl-gamma-glutamyl-phosphate reductase [Balneolales bacterium]
MSYDLGKKSGKTLKAGIAGGTGYTGSELIRLITAHPVLELVAVTSESKAGNTLDQEHPQFSGFYDLRFITVNEMDTDSLDVLFLALPHRVSMEFMAEHKNISCKVVDLSGDFRLRNADTYEKWYQTTHKARELNSRAVYGMPELYRDEIKHADLVANPGCYPTSSILPLLPIMKNDLAEIDSIVIDAKSGITGAGASAKPNTHFPNAYDNFTSYGLKTHRHTPEIEQALQFVSTGGSVLVQFTPHLLPVNRGILTTTYSKAKKGVREKDVQEAFSAMYQNEPFIRLRNMPPELRYVRGTNFCDIFFTLDERTNRIITVSAIDNLVKGAAGQAIHNANIMFGLEETTGLLSPAICP